MRDFDFIGWLAGSDRLIGSTRDSVRVSVYASKKSKKKTSNFDLIRWLIDLLDFDWLTDSHFILTRSPQANNMRVRHKRGCDSSILLNTNKTRAHTFHWIIEFTQQFLIVKTTYSLNTKRIPTHTHTHTKLPVPTPPSQDANNDSFWLANWPHQFILIRHHHHTHPPTDQHKKHKPSRPPPPSHEH